MQRSVASRDHPTLPGEIERLALPVGHDAAGAFDDRRRGEKVVAVETGIDGEVGAAAGKAGIAVATAAILGELYRRIKARKGRTVRLGTKRGFEEVM